MERTNLISAIFVISMACLAVGLITFGMPIKSNSSAQLSHQQMTVYFDAIVTGISYLSISNTTTLEVNGNNFSYCVNSTIREGGFSPYNQTLIGETVSVKVVFVADASFENCHVNDTTWTVLK